MKTVIHRLDQRILLFTIFLIPLFFSGCASTHSQQKIDSSSAKIPKTSPAGPSESRKSNLYSKYSDEIISELSLIESAFLAQNCDLVMEHSKVLQNKISSTQFLKLPAFVQASIYLCDAKKDALNSEHIKQSIANLKQLNLKYPIINEAWLHSTLGDLYSVLNDNANAILEKKLARDLLLAQQQDVSSLNVEILKLDPSDQSAQATNTTSSSINKSQTIDQILTSAQQMINNDTPEQAIALLDTIPSAQKNTQVKQIRGEAVNNLVTNLRFKVSALFKRSTEQTGAVKKSSLEQCEQILKGIVQNYPEYQDMTAVLNNLKQVQRELAKN